MLTTAQVTIATSEHPENGPITDQNLLDQLREELKKCPFYQDDDTIYVLKKEFDYTKIESAPVRFGDCLRTGEVIYIGYNARRRHPLDAITSIASFTCQIENGTCDILGIEVHPDHWRKGYGRMLIGVISTFAKSLNCKEMSTFPSGMGKLFWPSMGFVRASPKSSWESWASYVKLLA